MLSALDSAVEATSKGRISECVVDDFAAAVSSSLRGVAPVIIGWKKLILLAIIKRRN
jgi:hypothetical protein